MFDLEPKKAGACSARFPAMKVKYTPMKTGLTIDGVWTVYYKVTGFVHIPN